LTGVAGLTNDLLHLLILVESGVTRLFTFQESGQMGGATGNRSLFGQGTLLMTMLCLSVIGIGSGDGGRDRLVGRIMGKVAEVLRIPNSTAEDSIRIAVMAGVLTFRNEAALSRGIAALNKGCFVETRLLYGSWKA
jgi:hypothetical protein